MSFTPTLHSLSCFYELAPLKSDEKPSIPVYVMKNMFPVVANAILRICSATCSPTPPNAQSSPLAQFRAALFLLALCTLHIAHCTLHHSAHIAHYTTTLECTHPGLVQCTMSTKYSTAFPQLLSTVHCRALVWSGILIKALRPFSNRKLNSPPPSQLNKKTRNTKRLKTAKVLLNCRMGNLFCRLHNIESPTSNKGGQRTLNIA